MMMNHSTQLGGVLAAEEEKLLACVHCGLCLEACPTYLHTGNENDSPRGRIYLMRAVEEERLSSSSKAFASHINRCLGCRACEQACPAGVEYGQLLEAARAELLNTESKSDFQSRFLRFVLKHIWLHPARLRAAFAFARFMRRLKLASLLHRTGLAKLISPRFDFALALLVSSSAAKLDQYKDQAIKPEKHNGTDARSENVDTRRTQAFIFKGCVTEGLFARVNRATVRVLEVNGCAVSGPEGQVCCGALHAHAGDLEGARVLARRNIDAFMNDDDTPVITNAGGCGAMLAGYAHLLANDAEYAERAREFSQLVRDISQQLESTGIRKGAEVKDCVTTYDASCHLLYGQRAGAASLKMLHAIAGINLVPLEGSEVCCGGAGIYNLLEPELSSRVLKEKLQHIKQTGAQLLATGNPGCHMQIGAGAQLARLRLSLCHPIELLDESYRRAGFYERDDEGFRG